MQGAAKLDSPQYQEPLFRKLQEPVVRKLWVRKNADDQESQATNQDVEDDEDEAAVADE